MQASSFIGKRNEYRDLAPEITRQRLVIEGYPVEPVSHLSITNYLRELAATIDMKPITEPITHRSDLFGWAGWVHWETSGAHVYAWDQPRLFFSSDIYTCKAFDVHTAVEFTGRFFSLTQLVYKSV